MCSRVGNIRSLTARMSIVLALEGTRSFCRDSCPPPPEFSKNILWVGEPLQNKENTHQSVAKVRADSRHAIDRHVGLDGRDYFSYYVERRTTKHREVGRLAIPTPQSGEEATNRVMGVAWWAG